MNENEKKNNRFVTILWMILCGMIFGVVAAMVFLVITFSINRWIVPVINNQYPVAYNSNDNLAQNGDETDISDYEPIETEKDDTKDESNHAQLIGENNDEEELFDAIDDYLDDKNSMTVADVASKCMSSIVAINITMDYEIFGYTAEGKAAGSGIIVGKSDTELLIATNYHVVEDNKTLTVMFCDGKSANGTVKGKKVSMDLAVVAINLEDIEEDTLSAISVASIGNSDSLVVGEPVVAIGNAMGYGQSVTHGVVSAVNREMKVESGEIGKFIQTDAAINPGNSGGALFNMNGELVGINSNKLMSSSVEGMGYAIPVNEASPIINQLMNQDELVALPEEEQSSIGITGMDIDDNTLSGTNVRIPKGVYIQEVYPQGTADIAGLKRGDIITEIDGNSVISMAELQRYMASIPKGTETTITYRRYDGDKYAEDTVTVESKGKTE